MGEGGYSWQRMLWRTKEERFSPLFIIFRAVQMKDTEGVTYGSMWTINKITTNSLASKASLWAERKGWGEQRMLYAIDKTYL